ncbi:MAG: hypothetical protein JNM52_01735 [Betaproteobacteria bacterium]|nr:hypothetical protein [Betaproteobacteria bacterium]
MSFGTQSYKIAWCRSLVFAGIVLVSGSVFAESRQGQFGVSVRVLMRCGVQVNAVDSLPSTQNSGAAGAPSPVVSRCTGKQNQPVSITQRRNEGVFDTAAASVKAHSLSANVDSQTIHYTVEY